MSINIYFVALTDCNIHTLVIDGAENTDDHC